MHIVFQLDVGLTLLQLLMYLSVYHPPKLNNQIFFNFEA